MTTRVLPVPRRQGQEEAPWEPAQRLVERDLAPDVGLVGDSRVFVFWARLSAWQDFTTLLVSP